MSDGPLVELVKVGKEFANGTVALDDVDLAIRGGEFVALLGPSGCGKSTVLRLIAGLTSPSRGTIRRTSQGEQTARRRDSPSIGCVFQEPTLMPWASVWNNIFLPLRLQGVRRAQAAGPVNEALSLVGLDKFGSAYPRELSGGMKMRASIARALVTHPQLLLLDEPFAALDEITRSRLNDDVLTLWREHRWSALFITHSVYEAVYLSTRVLVMSPRPGRIVDEFAVDLPLPRTAETRTSARFVVLCRRASQSLERAMAADAEASYA
jgi:NitT/TauT family transport system ATP-binding protein